MVTTLVVSILIEVLLQKGVRNLKKLLTSSLFTAFFFISFLLALTFGANYVDSNVPSSKEVKSISIYYKSYCNLAEFNNDYSDDYNRVLSKFFNCSDPKFITKSLDVIDKLVTTSNFNNNLTLSSSCKNIEIYVVYNNSPIMRVYKKVNVELLEKELSSIFNDPEYKKLLLAPLKTFARANYPVYEISTAFYNDGEFSKFNDISIEYDYDTRKNLTNALITDIQNANYFSVLSMACENKGKNLIGSADIDLRPKEMSPRSNVISFHIFDTYQNTLKVLRQLKKQ